jgi:hypothetical protein
MSWVCKRSDEMESFHGVQGNPQQKSEGVARTVFIRNIYAIVSQNNAVFREE